MRSTLVIVLATLLALATAVRVSAVVDEPKHVVNGLYFARDMRCCVQDEPPMALLHALPLLSQRLHLPPIPDDILYFNPKFLYLDPRHAEPVIRIGSRLATVAAFAYLLVIFRRWSTELVGPEATLRTLPWLAFCPTLLAHGSVATQDLFLATACTLAFFQLYRYLEGPTTRGAVLVGLALGLVYLSRAAGIVVHVIALGTWLVGSVGRVRGRSLLLHALALLVIPIAVLDAGYVFRDLPVRLVDLDLQAPSLQALQASVLGTVPLPLPAGFIEAVDFSRNDVVVRENAGLHYYAFGAVHDTGHRWYFLAALLIKTPLLTLAVVLLGAWGWARDRGGRRASHLALVAFPVAFLAMNSFLNAFHVGVRYVLPVYPFLLLFAGYALKRPGTGWAAVVPVVTALASFPNFLGYMNGVSQVVDKERMLVDSNLDWGQMNYLVAAHAGPDTPVSGTLIEPFPERRMVTWVGDTPRAGMAVVSKTRRHQPPLVRWPELLRDPTPSAVLGGAIDVYRLESEADFRVAFVNEWEVSEPFALASYPKVPPNLRMAWAPSSDEIAYALSSALHPVETTWGNLSWSEPRGPSCFLAVPREPLEGAVYFSGDDYAWVLGEDGRILAVDDWASAAVLGEHELHLSTAERLGFLVCNVEFGTGITVAASGP